MGYNNKAESATQEEKVVLEEAEEGAKGGDENSHQHHRYVKHARALLRAPTWLSTTTVKSG